MCALQAWMHGDGDTGNHFQLRLPYLSEGPTLGGSAVSSALGALPHVVHVTCRVKLPSAGRLARRCGALAPELAAHVARVLELRDTPVAKATAALGRNCHMPNALQTPLQVRPSPPYLREHKPSTDVRCTCPSLRARFMLRA